MMLKRTFVAASDTAGVGVFAAEPIQAGELIWKLDPNFDRLIHLKDLETYPPHMQEFMVCYGYPHRENPNYLVLEVDNGRFMNHSERPNTRFDEFTAGYAIQDIQIGEELLCDYSEFDPGYELTPTLVHLKSGVKNAQRVE